MKKYGRDRLLDQDEGMPVISNGTSEDYVEAV